MTIIPPSTPVIPVDEHMKQILTAIEVALYKQVQTRSLSHLTSTIAMDLLISSTWLRSRWNTGPAMWKRVPMPLLRYTHSGVEKVINASAACQTWTSCS